jgi:O-antigen ligase
VFQGVLGIIQFVQGASLGLTALGESQVVNGMQGSSFVTLNGEVFLRAYGTFPHPNVFAGFLLVSFLLGLYFFKQSKSYLKWLSFVLMVLSLGFMIFTFSRISIALVILCSIITVIYPLLSKGKAFSFSFVLLIERFSNLFVGGDSSWQDRINLMKASVRVIKEHLVFGTGLGNFVRGMETFVPRTVNGVMLLQPVHNVLLLGVSELGLLGFGLVSLLLYKVFKANIGRMSIFKILVILVFVVVACFDHYLWSLPQGQVMSGIFFLLLLF